MVLKKGLVTHFKGDDAWFRQDNFRSGQKEMTDIDPARGLILVRAIDQSYVFSQFYYTEVAFSLQGLQNNRIFCVIWVSTFISQILIVQYGGAWFSTAPLTLTQWFVCLVLGVSALVWGQVVATIPSKKLPKKFAVGRGEVGLFSFLDMINIKKTSSSNTG